MRPAYLSPEAAMMWTVPSANRARQIRINLAKLPDQTWDWTVWEVERPGSSAFGVRATPDIALADAVVAASRLCAVGTVDAAGSTPKACLTSAAPFASVEKAPSGPSLFVGGVLVQSWISSDYEADAETMAKQINSEFANRARR